MAVSNGFLCSYLSSKLKLYYHDRIPLRLKAEKQLRNKNHTEDWALGRHPRDNGHMAH